MSVENREVEITPIGVRDEPFRASVRNAEHDVPSKGSLVEKPQLPTGNADRAQFEQTMKQLEDELGIGDIKNPSEVASTNVPLKIQPNRTIPNVTVEYDRPRGIWGRFKSIFNRDPIIGKPLKTRDRGPSGTTPPEIRIKVPGRRGLS